LYKGCRRGERGEREREERERREGERERGREGEREVIGGRDGDSFCGGS
jgi:hypothetical protein